MFKTIILPGLAAALVVAGAAAAYSVAVAGGPDLALERPWAGDHDEDDHGADDHGEERHERGDD